MWRQIRGMGLSYHYRCGRGSGRGLITNSLSFPYSLSISPETGHLSFVLFKSSQLVQAYEVARDIVVSHMTIT